MLRRPLTGEMLVWLVVCSSHLMRRTIASVHRARRRLPWKRFRTAAQIPYPTLSHDARPRIEVGLPQAVAGGRRNRRQQSPRGTAPPAAKRSIRRDGCLEPVRVNRRHRHVDQPGMAVPVRGVQGYPARQAPEFRQNSVYPAPVVEVEERQPELSPARNAENPLGLYEAPGRFDQRDRPARRRAVSPRRKPGR